MVRYFIILVVLSMIFLAAIAVASDLHRLSRVAEQSIQGFETISDGVRLIDYFNNGPLAPLFRRLPVIQVMCDEHWQLASFCGV